MKADTLADIVARSKARWLKRVIYSPSLPSTPKILAYAISDHLNCVTRDAWPSQKTLACLLGTKCEKTIQRCARQLREAGFIRLDANRPRRGNCRYAPVFIPSDWDKPVRAIGHSKPTGGDSNVRQSLLEIHLESSSTAGGAKRTAGPQRDGRSNLAMRGSIEVRLATALGASGWEVLGRLQAFDPSVVNRLCDDFAEGLVHERELAAARLAAEQVTVGSFRQIQQGGG
jgi:hypothetical protein